MNVVGLCPRHLTPDMPFLRKFLARDGAKLVHVRPLLPAVTSTMQATYLTGTPPSAHGIVGNLWYDRDYAEHRCWKQSNHLVKGKKLWEHLRDEDPAYTCAKVFWWNNLYSTANYQISAIEIGSAAVKSEISGCKCALAKIEISGCFGNGSACHDEIPYHTERASCGVGQGYGSPALNPVPRCTMAHRIGSGRKINHPVFTDQHISERSRAGSEISGSIHSDRTIS